MTATECRELRSRIATCRRLARLAPDAETEQKLEALASEYETRIERASECAAH